MLQHHILAIDDDSSQLASYRRVLRRSGYRVSTASNGRDGLRRVFELAPDLVLVDVTMPVVSGHEFLRRLRRLERRLGAAGAGNPPGFRAPPVIFVSGRNRTHQRVDGLDAGAADYIAKPFDAEELRARIRRVLRDARGLDRASDVLLTPKNLSLASLRATMAAANELAKLAAVELERLGEDGIGEHRECLAAYGDDLRRANERIESLLRDLRRQVAA